MLAASFDYYGHGRNLRRLAGDITEVEGATLALLEQTRGVVEHALGHSMASDIVVRYAATDERVDATIAVSMFSPAVTAEHASNLLVIAGVIVIYFLV